MEMPSGTSMAIDLLVRLQEPAGASRFRDVASRTVTRLSGQFQDHPESWAAAIATLNRHKLPLTTEGSAAAKNASAQQAAAGFRVPVTADHVRATAAGRSNQNENEVLVTIKVDDQYHINANPASFDFLIPTSVTFKSIKPSTIEYPKPTRFTAEFAPDGLDVYEGSIAIVVKFPKGSVRRSSTVQGSVTAQACNNQNCLPPSTLPIAAAVNSQ
jgi:hypothetical protein